MTLEDMMDAAHPQPGRAGPKPGRTWPPRSFGQPAEPEPVETPPAEPAAAAAGPVVSVVDGKVVLEVNGRLVLDQGAAHAFYEQVRELTALAIADGYAAVMGVPPPGATDPPAAAAVKP